MKLKLVKFTDEEKWDDFVLNHPYGWITHLSSWKNIIESCFKNTKGHYYALIDENCIIAGLSIYNVKSWLLGKRLISVPFATFNDPLVSSSTQMDLLLNGITSLADELKIKSMEFRALNSISHIDKSKFDLNKRNSFKQHFLLLDKSLEELKLSFNKRNVRKRIRQSLESNLTIKIADSKADVDAFYKLYLTTKKRLGLPPFPYNFVYRLWEVYSPKNQLDLILAVFNNKIVGGLLFFKFKNRVSAEIIAYEESYKDFYLSQFLYWHAIEIAKNENYEIFDFGKTAVFNEGLMTYKSHWGTELHDVPVYVYPESIKQNNEPRENMLIYKIVKSIGKKLPYSIFRIYGNLFYHHFA